MPNPIPKVDPETAALAAAALPSAVTNLAATARAFREARRDFCATILHAGDSALGAVFARPDMLEQLFATMNIATNEARHISQMADGAGHAVMQAGTMSRHAVYVCLARGQARELLTCTCGTCEVCQERAATVEKGGDPLEVVAGNLLAQLEPSGLVDAGGAPIKGGARWGRRAKDAAGS